MVLLASQLNASFPSFFFFFSFEHGSRIQVPHALELINFKATCGEGLDMKICDIFWKVTLNF